MEVLAYKQQPLHFFVRYGPRYHIRIPLKKKIPTNSRIGTRIAIRGRELSETGSVPKPPSS